MNLDGVLHGAKLYAEKQIIESGGSGGLVINTASLAGILYGMDKNRWPCLESDDRKANSPIMIIGQFHQIFSSISYQISKHGVVALTRSFGHPKVVKKTGIKVAHHHHHHHGKSNHQEKWSGLLAGLISRLYWILFMNVWRSNQITQPSSSTLCAAHSNLPLVCRHWHPRWDWQDSTPKAGINPLWQWSPVDHQQHTITPKPNHTIPRNLSGFTSARRLF